MEQQSEDRSKTEEQVLDLVSKFRILDDWTIEYDPDFHCKGQCFASAEKKSGAVYDWGSSSAQPDDYLIHAILHMAFRAAVALGRDGEESFIQDVCGMLYPNTTTTTRRERIVTKKDFPQTTEELRIRIDEVTRLSGGNRPFVVQITEEMTKTLSRDANQICGVHLVVGSSFFIPSVCRDTEADWPLTKKAVVEWFSRQEMLLGGWPTRITVPRKLLQVWALTLGLGENTTTLFDAAVTITDTETFPYCTAAYVPKEKATTAKSENPKETAEDALQCLKSMWDK